jgi:hypothetical protein
VTGREARCNYNPPELSGVYGGQLFQPYRDVNSFWAVAREPESVNLNVVVAQPALHESAVTK